MYHFLNHDNFGSERLEHDEHVQEPDEPDDEIDAEYEPGRDEHVLVGVERQEAQRHADREDERRGYVEIVALVLEVVQYVVLDHFGLRLAKQVLFFIIFGLLI